MNFRGQNMFLHLHPLHPNKNNFSQKTCFGLDKIHELDKTMYHFEKNFKKKQSKKKITFCVFLNTYFVSAIGLWKIFQKFTPSHFSKKNQVGMFSTEICALTKKYQHFREKGLKTNKLPLLKICIWKQMLYLCEFPLT